MRRGGGQSVCMHTQPRSYMMVTRVYGSAMGSTCCSLWHRLGMLIMDRRSLDVLNAVIVSARLSLFIVDSVRLSRWHRSATALCDSLILRLATLLRGTGRRF